LYPYESVLILDPEIKKEDVSSLLETLKKLIENNQGELEEVEEWGIKRLAYPVLKKSEGRYVLLKFKSKPQVIPILEKNFKISEYIIKHLTVRREILKNKPTSKVKESKI